MKDLDKNLIKWMKAETLYYLSFLNGGVLRNLNMYSPQKLYPLCSATWLSEALFHKMSTLSNLAYKRDLSWPMGSASTGRAPQQLTESPFKYLT